MSDTEGVSLHPLPANKPRRKRAERTVRHCRTCGKSTEHSKRKDARYRSGFNLVCLACCRERQRLKNEGRPTDRRTKRFKHPRIGAVDAEIARLRKVRARLLSELEGTQPDDGEPDNEDLF